MANRQLVSQDILINWMTAEVAKFEGCENCQVKGVYMLIEPDPEGCNWSLQTIRVTGVPREIYEPAVALVVAKARNRYNLK